MEFDILLWYPTDSYMYVSGTNLTKHNTISMSKHVDIVK